MFILDRIGSKGNRRVTSEEAQSIWRPGDADDNDCWMWMDDSKRFEEEFL